jgi:hypothetical protein
MRIQWGSGRDAFWSLEPRIVLNPPDASSPNPSYVFVRPRRSRPRHDSFRYSHSKLLGRSILWPIARKSVEEQTLDLHVAIFIIVTLGCSRPYEAPEVFSGTRPEPKDNAR